MMKYFKVGIDENIPIKEIKDLLGTEDVEILDYKEFIKKAHQEAHECNSTQEIHDWIEWFSKQLKE